MTDSVSRSPDPFIVAAGKPIVGEIEIPASKSVTQRYFNLALVGRVPILVKRPLFSEDTQHFLEALAATGFTVQRGTDQVRLQPRSSAEASSEIAIDCGAGGTMLRFLTAALTTLPGAWRLDGIPRLRERPLGPLLAALRQLGARLTCCEREGYAPVLIDGDSLQGGRAVLDAGESSQFLSALLMACLRARREVVLEVDALTSAPYVDLTTEAIELFGGVVRREGNSFFITPGPLVGDELTVEGDDSAAAYPAAAAALCGGPVKLRGLKRDSLQGDRKFLDVLVQMGAQIDWLDNSLDSGLEARGGRLRAVEVDLSKMPDQVPTLAALAPFAHGTTRIFGVPHLRLKESDRLSAMARELERLGASVEELRDGLVIPGVWADRAPPTTPVEVLTYGDHRIAMSLALVGLRRPGVSIRDPDVVAKSYPSFWNDLRRLTHT